MIWSDLPYNVNYANSAKDKLRGKHRPILNDNLGEGFYDFVFDALSLMLPHCDGAVYIAMSSSELDTLQAAFHGRWKVVYVHHLGQAHLHPGQSGLPASIRTDPVWLAGRQQSALVWRSRSR